MRYRRLGGTGLVVSELCLGTMTFGNGEGRFKPIAGVDQAGADALVERSLAAGINFFDTADSYSSGESEQILGRSLKTIGVKRSDVIIATKVSSEVGTGRMIAARPADISWIRSRAASIAWASTISISIKSTCRIR